MCYHLFDFSGGVGEPLRAIRCANALTPVHSLVPMISLGYAALDLFDGLYTSRLDFVLHGLTMVSVLAFLCEIGKVRPHTSNSSNEGDCMVFS